MMDWEMRMRLIAGNAAGETEVGETEVGEMEVWFLTYEGVLYE